jgi:TPR repeat protein
VALALLQEDWLDLGLEEVVIQALAAFVDRVLVADAAERQRRGDRIEGGGRDGDADNWDGVGGFHSRANRCASAIWSAVIYGVNLSRALLAASKPCAAAKLNHIWPRTAVKLFRGSAEQGNDRGQYDLGAAYVNGLGVPKDYGWRSRKASA